MEQRGGVEQRGEGEGQRGEGAGQRGEGVGNGETKIRWMNEGRSWGRAV